MKNIFTIYLLIFSLLTFGQSKTQIGTDTVIIGKPGSTLSKRIKLGNTQEIRTNTTTNKIEFAHDGINFKPLGSGTGSGVSNGVNLITNDSFEDPISTGWTSSGGTLTQETYDFSLDNNTKFARFVASAAGQYVEQVVSVPTSLGVGCQADFKKANISTAGLFKVQAIDVSNNVLAEQVIGVSSWVKVPTISFPCPNAGLNNLKLRMTSIGAGTIDFDLAYIGSNQNTISISQAKYVGSLNYTNATNCFWSQPSTTFADMPADADCATPMVTGEVIAPDTKIPGLKLNTKLGSYMFIYKGNFLNNAPAGLTYLRLTDGTNFSQAQVGPYLSSQTENTYIFRMESTTVGLKTFNLNSRRTSTTPSLEIFANTSDVTLEIDVYYYPSTQETAVSPEQSSWFIDANIGGQNPNLGTGSVSSYSEIPATTLDLVINSSKGSAGAEIPCVSGTASTGLTCPTANESLGISFVPPSSGLYETCFAFTHSSGSTGNLTTTFQLVETPNTALTILQEGGQRVQSGASVTNSQGPRIPNIVCGTFNFSDTSKRTIRLMYEQIASGATSSEISADRDSTLGQRDIKITVRPLLSAYNRPILTGDQVTVPGSTKTIEARAYYSSVGAVLNQKGNMMTGTCSSVSNGDYVSCPFTSTWTSVPLCGISLSGTSTGTNAFPRLESVTTTGFNAYIRNTSNTSTASQFMVDCLGEK